jgi:hypothetical protein
MSPEGTAIYTWLIALLGSALLAAHGVMYTFQGRQIRRTQDSVDGCINTNAKTFATKEMFKLQAQTTGEDIKELKTEFKEAKTLMVNMSAQFKTICREVMPWDGENRRKEHRA